MSAFDVAVWVAQACAYGLVAARVVRAAEHLLSKGRRARLTSARGDHS